MAENKVFYEGNPECKHDRVLYIDFGITGQSWHCDYPECERQEAIGYSDSGEKIKFPPLAYIMTENAKFGGHGVYSHRADENGLAKLLSEKERIFVGQ